MAPRARSVMFATVKCMMPRSERVFPWLNSLWVALTRPHPVLNIWCLQLPLTWGNRAETWEWTFCVVTTALPGVLLTHQPCQRTLLLNFVFGFCHIVTVLMCFSLLWTGNELLVFSFLWTRPFLCFEVNPYMLGNETFDYLLTSFLKMSLEFYFLA